MFSCIKQAKQVEDSFVSSASTVFKLNNNDDALFGGVVGAFFKRID